MLVVVANHDDGEDQETDMVASGLALVGIGATFGPSVGHVYAGEWAHGLATMGLRLLAFGGSAAAIAGGIQLLDDGDAPGAGGVVMLLGALAGTAGLGLMAYDLIDAPEAARRANREAHQPGISLSIGPGAIGARGSF
jgi:hypothetical protein